MPTIPLHPPAASNASTPLPPVFQTPAGLALLEVQGTINLPEEITSGDIPFGSLVFPPEVGTGEWGGKKVFLYVGQFQRMTGEVKKLAAPLAVIRRKEVEGRAEEGGEEREGVEGEELEVVDIVRYKMLFKNRPEPVSA